MAFAFTKTKTEDDIDSLILSVRQSASQVVSVINSAAAALGAIDPTKLRTDLSPVQLVELNDAKAEAVRLKNILTRPRDDEQMEGGFAL